MRDARHVVEPAELFVGPHAVQVPFLQLRRGSSADIDLNNGVPVQKHFECAHQHSCAFYRYMPAACADDACLFFHAVKTKTTIYRCGKKLAFF